MEKATANDLVTIGINANKAKPMIPILDRKGPVLKQRVRLCLKSKWTLIQL